MGRDQFHPDDDDDDALMMKKTRRDDEFVAESRSARSKVIRNERFYRASYREREVRCQPSVFAVCAYFTPLQQRRITLYAHFRRISTRSRNETSS
jgi:hypothetical protein